MATGDVTSDIVNVNTSAINTAMAALKVTNNDYWMIAPAANGQQLVITNIENVGFASVGVPADGQTPYDAVVGSDDADYETDGTADQIQINAAIVAVNAAGGGIVFVKSGNYSLSGSISMRSNVCLQGCGWSTKFSLVNGVDNVTISCDGISNFQLKDFKTDGNRANQSSGSGVWCASDCSDYEVSGLYVTNSYSNNIICGGTDFLINRCIVDTCDNDGIVVHTGERCAVTNCTATGCILTTGNGFGVYNNSTNVHEIAVSNCVAYSNAGYGFNIEHAFKTTVSNCVSLSNKTGFGALSTSGDNSDYIVFQGCISVTNTENGFGIKGGQYITMNGCQSVNDTGVGIEIGGSTASHNLTITNNQIYSPSGYGLRAFNTGPTTVNYNITGNTFTACGSIAIEMGTAPDAIIANNIINGTASGIRTGGPRTQILGNKITTNGGSNGIYIDAVTGEDFIISGNFVTNSDDQGIYAAAPNGIINNNIVKNSGQNSGTGYGIYVNSAGDNITVIGNCCYDDQGTKTQEYGIAISSNADRVVVVGNACHSNGTTDIDNGSTDGVTTGNIA